MTMQKNNSKGLDEVNKLLPFIEIMAKYPYSEYPEVHKMVGKLIDKAISNNGYLEKIFYIQGREYSEETIQIVIKELGIEDSVECIFASKPIRKIEYTRVMLEDSTKIW